MTDPFEALRIPLEPVAPDKAFAERLRDQLRSAILEGTEMTTSETTTVEQSATEAKAHSLTPYLVVRDARAAVDFYIEVFGARRRGEPIVMDDGKVGHVEVAIGDSVLMMAEEFPEEGHVVATTGGPLISVEVSDVDATMARAAELGARIDRPAEDTPYGRHGNIADPYGQRWIVAQASQEPAASEVPIPPHGAAGYFTFTVPDDEAAKEFYGSVLGWRFSPGRVPRAWRAEGSGLVGSGFWGGQSYAGWKVMYGVIDLAAALDRVRAAGGTAGEPETYPYGVTADCVDNQGVEFWLWQIPASE